MELELELGKGGGGYLAVHAEENLVEEKSQWKSETAAPKQPTEGRTEPCCLLRRYWKIRIARPPNTNTYVYVYA